MSGRDPQAPIPEGFQCEYAEPGEQACPAWRCDCFVATHPDTPFDLHPEDFQVAEEAPDPMRHFRAWAERIREEDRRDAIGLLDAMASWTKEQWANPDLRTFPFLDEPNDPAHETEPENPADSQ